MWFATYIKHSTSVGQEVVFMIKFLLILIYGLLISIIINVALLTVIYINWVNKELQK